MEGLSLGENVRLILAFDEYETLHNGLAKDVEQAEELLGAMRSFSQYQNRIVFLFIGAAFLSDLKKPNWSRYFVQMETLRQSICRQLVALANQNNNPNLQPEHLEQVLDEKILDYEYQPIYIFWKDEFCDPEFHPHAQKTVLEVIQQQPITHREELKRMLRHRYVLKMEGAEYKYRMAVPLFKMWIRRHGLEEF